MTIGTTVGLARTSAIDEVGWDVHRYCDRMPFTAVGASSTGVTGIEGIKEE